MKHFWMAVSISCLSGAAIALWRQRVDVAFVIATIGAMAWFLNYRARLKELIVDPVTNQSSDVNVSSSESNED
jgi:hypothetical protein